MRENRTYGSEGGAAQAVPTPIHSTGLLWVRPVVGRSWCHVDRRPRESARSADPPQSTNRVRA